MFLSWLPWIIIAAIWWAYESRKLRRAREGRERERRPVDLRDDHTRHERGYGTQWGDH